MGKSVDDKLMELSPSRQKRIVNKANRLKADYMTLQDLRKAHELTQAQLAKMLGKTQVTVAQMEKRSDLLLSTLRTYVEAMGGNLDLVVAFPDRKPVIIKGLSDLD